MCLIVMLCNTFSQFGSILFLCQFPHVLIFSLFLLLSVGGGITIFTKGKYCNESDTKPFLELFSLCGHCEEVPERTIPGLGAISGSGAAFVSTVLS